MNCWHCERPAHGVCQFCGRALCKDDAKTMPFITELYTNKNGEYKALVVADVLYCGVCKPKEDPISVAGLDN